MRQDRQGQDMVVSSQSGAKFSYQSSELFLVFFLVIIFRRESDRLLNRMPDRTYSRELPEVNIELKEKLST